MTELQTSVLTYLTQIICASVVLKLGGIVHWSWWWVLAPVWIPASIAGLIITFVVFARIRKRDYW